MWVIHAQMCSHHHFFEILLGSVLHLDVSMQDTFWSCQACSDSASFWRGHILTGGWLAAVKLHPFAKII